MYPVYKTNYNKIVYKPENFWAHFKARGFEVIESIRPS